MGGWYSKKNIDDKVNLVGDITMLLPKLVVLPGHFRGMHAGAPAVAKGRADRSKWQWAKGPGG